MSKKEKSVHEVFMENLKLARKQGSITRKEYKRIKKAVESLLKDAGS